MFYHDHLLVKEPGTPEPTPWHHDQPYYPIDGAMVGSLWLPLDPVDRATTVEFVAGSHRWGRWFRPRYFNTRGSALGAPEDGLEETPDIEADRAAYRILGWAMAPGDCVFFHALTLHGAGGNHTSRRRRAYATRWLGEDTRFATRPGRISPPLEGHGLRPGDALACDLFPKFWPPSEPALE